MAKRSDSGSKVPLLEWIQQQIKAGAGGGRLPTLKELEEACELVGISRSRPWLLVRQELVPPGLDPTAHPEYRKAWSRLQGLGQGELSDLTPSIGPLNN